jgi:phosphotransferase system enzyme I (PtsP)
MITTTDDLHACRQVVGDARSKLLQEGIEVPEVPIGVMVEVPATVAIARHLARDADFFALGTNDLIQYMLAADRGNDLVKRYYDPLHPAILQAIEQMVQITGALNRGLCICGEMASDPGCFALLVGLGLREFSVSSPSILSLKALLSQYSSARLVQLAQRALQQDHGGATRTLIDELLQESDLQRNR